MRTWTNPVNSITSAHPGNWSGTKRVTTAEINSSARDQQSNVLGVLDAWNSTITHTTVMIPYPLNRVLKCLFLVVGVVLIFSAPGSMILGISVLVRLMKWHAWLLTKDANGSLTSKTSIKVDASLTTQWKMMTPSGKRGTTLSSTMTSLRSSLKRSNHLILPYYFIKSKNRKRTARFVSE